MMVRLVFAKLRKQKHSNQQLILHEQSTCYVCTYFLVWLLRPIYCRALADKHRYLPAYLIIFIAWSKKQDESNAPDVVLLFSVSFQ